MREPIESDVEVRTADGVCNAAFFHPADGAYPGVIFWADAFGLRQASRDMGRRLAAEGYAVLVPNPFYRMVKEIPFEPGNFDFKNEKDVAKLRPLLGSATAPGHVETDAAGIAEFFDGRTAVKRSAKMGVQGYCLGGPMAVRTAAALEERVGAAASFHGGGLVTDKPDSPHLLAPRIHARMYFGVAGNDDAKDPGAKDKLREAFEAAGVPVEVELYADAMHGWCMPDFPVYKKDDAERAWGKLLELYRAGLAS